MRTRRRVPFSSVRINRVPLYDGFPVRGNASNLICEESTSGWFCKVSDWKPRAYYQNFTVLKIKNMCITETLRLKLDCCALYLYLSQKPGGLQTQ